jgi:hypothetical protein
VCRQPVLCPRTRIREFQTTEHTEHTEITHLCPFAVLSPSVVLNSGLRTQKSTQSANFVQQGTRRSNCRVLIVGCGVSRGRYRRNYVASMIRIVGIAESGRSGAPQTFLHQPLFFRPGDLGRWPKLVCLPPSDHLDSQETLAGV